MNIIIIGAEAAGASASAKAKRLYPEANVRVYEKSDIVSFGACGLPYYLGNQFEDAHEMIARTPEQFLKTGVDIKIHHEVLAIDDKNKKITVKNLINNMVFEDSYDKLMLAVGATPIIPTIKNIQLERVFTLKTLQDGLYIKALMQSSEIKHIIILGAGYIGLEVAEALTAIGKNVRIIELDQRILKNTFDKDMTDLVEQKINKHCALHLNEQVQELIGEQYIKAVRTSQGEYPADALILATGVKPNDLLYKNLGLKTLNNGAIITDHCGQTSLPDIYAAGDCAAIYNRVSKNHCYMPLATVANKLGRIVGENLTGKNIEFPGTLATAALRVFEVEAARTGLSEEEAIKLGITYKTVVIKDKNHSNYVPGQTDIIVKLIYNSDTWVLLGGQIIGEQNTAVRIDILATAIWQEMKIDELAMLDFMYAPPFARPWNVLNIAGSSANNKNTKKVTS